MMKLFAFKYWKIFYGSLLILASLTFAFGYAYVKDVEIFPREDIVSYKTIECDGRYFLGVNTKMSSAYWPIGYRFSGNNLVLIRQHTLHFSSPKVDIQGRFMRAFIEDISDHSLAECIFENFKTPHIFIAEVSGKFSLDNPPII